MEEARKKCKKGRKARNGDGGRLETINLLVTEEKQIEGRNKP